jgi:hypothetical protein
MYCYNHLSPKLGIGCCASDDGFARNSEATYSIDSICPLLAFSSLSPTRRPVKTPLSIISEHASRAQHHLKEVQLPFTRLSPSFQPASILVKRELIDKKRAR